ncbi:hypothetical protein K8Q94_02445 [Candidatus Nomurabacteria bacterium]|nr:hypothetical protein [Candidatus Nomurabacteria bacterium]
MKKEITVNILLNQIQIRKGDFEEIFSIPASSDLREFQLNTQQFIKNNLPQNYTFDDIDTYDIKVISN